LDNLFFKSHLLFLTIIGTLIPTICSFVIIIISVYRPIFIKVESVVSVAASTTHAKHGQDGDDQLLERYFQQGGKHGEVVRVK